MKEKEVRIERMRPDQLKRACENKPVAYFPLGALEFHGRHLPVGLDGLKAHDLACRAARRIGGVVVPPLYHGQGGEHGLFPWSWMIDQDTLTSIVVATLRGLERSGIKLVLLICGHYPNEAIGEGAIAQFRETGGTAEVRVLKECDAFPSTDSLLQGDHASKCETSLMLATDEATVDMAALSKNGKGDPLGAYPTPEPLVEGGWWFEKNPDHPWFGLAGQPEHSPLDASKALGEWAQERFIEHVGQVVAEVLPSSTA